MTLYDLLDTVGMLPALGEDLASQILHDLIDNPKRAQARLLAALARATKADEADECCF